jgi:hypothetical protein
MNDRNDRPPPDPPKGGPAKDDLADAYDALVNQYSGADPARKARPAPEKSAGARQGKDALVEAFDKVLEQEEQRRNAAALEGGSRRILAPLALTVLTAVSVYVWLAQPFNSAYPIPPVEVKDSHGLRQLMLAAAQVLEDYRQQNGRLPGSLEEAGIDVGPVSYQAKGSEYALQGTVGDSTYTLRWTVSNASEVELDAQGKPGGATP